MPKKTKKEKIIAEYRRKLSTIRETVPMNLERIKGASTPRQTDSSSPTSTHTLAGVVPMDRRVRRDLVKTLMLAAVAIGGEVVLSMMMNK
ncbi:hypothetical protein HY411_01460 [Candidatus Gottesmanbacteria bacterium]|nr:hypothetical protein [Candidatus Gottesmanbacteria bacterium]